MSENEGLGKIVRRGRRKLHNEKHNLHSSFRIVTAIKQKVRCAGHAPRMEEVRNSCNILVGKPQGKVTNGGLEVDGRRVTLKYAQQ